MDSVKKFQMENVWKGVEMSTFGRRTVLGAATFANKKMNSAHRVKYCVTHHAMWEKRVLKYFSAYAVINMVKPYIKTRTFPRR